MRQISSTNNPIIKDVVRLQRKRHRYASRQFLAEGEDLFDAALSRGIVPRQVFVREEAVAGLQPQLERLAAVDSRQEVELFSGGAAVMTKLSELRSGSRLVAVFPFFEQPLAAISFSGSAGPLLYLAGVRDPGNVGTLIRSAAALGASGVALDAGCADPYSPKALRGSMGVLFQLPLALGVEPDQLQAWAAWQGATIAAADAHEGEEAWSAPLAGSLVLALGAEREGLPAPLKQAAELMVRIPQTAAAESLNVAMAGTAILYEALRQRSLV